MLKDITNIVIQPPNPSILFTEIDEMRWNIQTIPPDKQIYKITPAFTNSTFRSTGASGEGNAETFINIDIITTDDVILYIIKVDKNITIYELLFKVHDTFCNTNIQKKFCGFIQTPRRICLILE